jgi:uncharacterized membrane protein YoaT (DUF817 family)
MAPTLSLCFNFARSHHPSWHHASCMTRVIGCSFWFHVSSISYSEYLLLYSILRFHAHACPYHCCSAQRRSPSSLCLGFVIVSNSMREYLKCGFASRWTQLTEKQWRTAVDRWCSSRQIPQSIWSPGEEKAPSTPLSGNVHPTAK